MEGWNIMTDIDEWLLKAHVWPDESHTRVNVSDAHAAADAIQSMRAKLAKYETDAIHTHDDDCQRPLCLLRAENDRLTEENRMLSAGSCDVDGGKLGDERGNTYCALQAENAALRGALVISSKKMETVLAAMDRHNEANGAHIIGPSLVALGVQIATNRTLLKRTDHVVK
jgi:hypothetical protein